MTSTRFVPVAGFVIVYGNALIFNDYSLTWARPTGKFRAVRFKSESMDALRDIVEFQSDAFAPALPEEAQVNPGVYGAELAYWLCKELFRRGVVTSYPESEDWGWFIDYSTDDGAEFSVHCSNVDGEKNRWQLSLRRFARKMFGRDKPPYDKAARLVAAIRDAVHSVAKPENVSWRWDDAG
jgi:hypothetical protein